MRLYVLKFLAILAVASPLALAGCHAGGDEHPTDNAGGSNSEHPSGGGSEHPN